MFEYISSYYIGVLAIALTYITVWLHFRRLEKLILDVHRQVALLRGALKLENAIRTIETGVIERPKKGKTDVR